MTPDFEQNQWFTQSVGIDIAKDKFTACIGMSNVEQRQVGEVVEFPNNPHGFNQLVKWANKETVKGTPIRFVMEPTGVYYEGLAYHLHKIHKEVYVVLPNKAREFAKFDGVKTKNDIVDARVLATLGVCDRKLKPWSPPKAIYREIRQMTRFCTSMKKTRTDLENQLEALHHMEGALPEIIRHYESLVKAIDKNIDKMEQKIEALIRKDAELARKVDKMLTIKGVGITTIVAIIAETNGFEMIHNRKQLASYAGLDVTEKDSGTVQSGHRLSKAGNSRIRAALYFPAIVAARTNPQMSQYYNRILTKNPDIKMKGVAAIMRKLLLLCYTIWKSEEIYDPDRTGKPIQKEAVE